MTRSYVIVDVFTDTRWTGNPLAVILEADGLDDQEMFAIARETNLSETTFVFRRPEAVEARDGIRVRIFTPNEELPFAGHPVLGTAWVLRDSERASRVVLDLKGGRIPVTFRTVNAVVTGEMVQPRPEFGEIHAAETIASFIGLSVEDLGTDVPCQTVSTGRPRIKVPLKSLDAMRRVRMDFDAIASYCSRTDKAAGIYLVTRETENPAAHLHARNILSASVEDPVTGSSGGACLAWAVKYGWAQAEAEVVIEQGSEIQRPGLMKGSAFRDANGVITEVRMGGQCVLTARGVLL